ncbi:unnamed protein product, partial [Rotaria sordida]
MVRPTIDELVTDSLLIKIMNGIKAVNIDIIDDSGSHCYRETTLKRTQSH